MNWAWEGSTCGDNDRGTPGTPERRTGIVVDKTGKGLCSAEGGEKVALAIIQRTESAQGGLHWALTSPTLMRSRGSAARWMTVGQTDDVLQTCATGGLVQLLKSSDLGRHSLLYLKEIGHGWFGKVLLGEVNVGLSTTQVVVQELKASASVQDQMHFLEEAQPYRTLQHSALLQSLAQCSEVTPYLLVMEFCPLGDVKSYLRSCRAADAVTPDPLTLQRMACDIASGLLHLHKYNFIHSDLALRNCLLTSEMTVKIGDYGLSHSRYKDDYFVTPDQIWVPLRWIAPELIDDVHGNLLVVDQTKDSNVWSLGVTIWELFELGNQPYRHYTDRQVLTYAVKEQQLKLTRPRIRGPLAERWYEVMQFCWLQPEQRPNSEEVHLLLTYLCAKGASEAKEDFEQRWNSLRPNLTGGSSPSHVAVAPLTAASPVLAHTPSPGDVEPASASRNSFPLLEQFSQDGFHSDGGGDDILTVTQTSRGGLNFEYKWEQARAEKPYCSSSTSGPLGQGNPHYQDIYYPVGNASTSGDCQGERSGHALGASPSYYEPARTGSGVGVVPVLSAHSPSVGSEYYIRIEEPAECDIHLDDSSVDYSPGLEAEDGSLSSGTNTPKPLARTCTEPSTYWSAATAADGDGHSAYDSDDSPAVSLTMEPLLRQTTGATSPVELGLSRRYFSPNQSEVFHRGESPIAEKGCRSEEDTPAVSQRKQQQPMVRLETPLGVDTHAQCLSSPGLGHCDPYLESNMSLTTTTRRTEGYYDMIGPLRKTLPMANHISIDIDTGNGGLLVGGGVRGDRDAGEVDDDLFSEQEAINWTSNHSANNNSMSFELRQMVQSQDSYLDFRYINTNTNPTANTMDLRPSSVANGQDVFKRGAETFSYMEATGREGGGCSSSTKASESVSQSVTTVSAEGHKITPAAVPGERPFSQPKSIPDSGYNRSPVTCMEPYLHSGFAEKQRGKGGVMAGDVRETTGGLGVGHTEGFLLEPVDSQMEASQGLDSGLEMANCSSLGQVDVSNCSYDDEDDDITDVTSGIFADFSLDNGDDVIGDELSPTHHGERPARNLRGTPESVDTLNMMSPLSSVTGASPREAFSPGDVFLHTFSLNSSLNSSSLLPKSLDSGYDTENNESPEFMLKEGNGNGEFLLDSEGNHHHPVLGGSRPAMVGANLGSGERGQEMLLQQVDLGDGVGVSMSASTSVGTELHIKGLCGKNPYRDSAYFSDYDTENEKSLQDEQSGFFSSPGGENDLTGRQRPRSVRTEERQSQVGPNGVAVFNSATGSKPFPTLPCSSAQTSGPGLSILAPFPPQMGGCLAKGSAPEEAVGLESEHSGEEPASESEGSATLLEASSRPSDQNNRNRASEDDYSPIQSLGSDSSTDYRKEVEKKQQEGEEATTEEEDMPEFNHVDEDGDDTRRAGEDDEDFEEIGEVGGDDCSGSEAGYSGRSNSAAGLTSSPSLISCSPSLQELCQTIERRAPLTEGEDEESDDSESDEELRSYNLQEVLSEEDSEEEVTGVPVVISDRSGARHLRSLLKMPTLLTQSFCDELESKKKAVSFFDDVTVFLFDQESPTGELADCTFSPGPENSVLASEGGTLRSDLHSHPTMGHHLHPDPNSLKRAPHATEDGNMSEDGGGFDWDDDIPLMTSPLSSPSTPESPPPTPVSAPSKAPDDKPVATVSQFSRFSVSPSRFSITHVPNSDTNPAGGNSEVDERE
ncbi:hypothetical protein DPEC_G00309740 [Dallia pectoralis]|uniref:Uncharacterized protein n=1 Tax=Dallia pectoralis TaxID=75939 RepID=A0ACC2FFB9_DALPE|nr:hypothetical protein DPEC_G00309740 [Dallia pectoralis]